MSRYPFVLAAFGLLIGLPPSAEAIDRTWDDGAGGKNWISTNNWSPNGVPQNVDDVSIGAHPNATDDTVQFGVFPPYLSTVFSLELSSGADLDLYNGRLVVIEDTTVGGGFGGGTLAELIVRPVQDMDVDALNTNTLTINAGGRLRMVGGSISVDGTAASEGVLEIQEGGSLIGYGVINLDDDNVPDFVDMLLNDGTFTVGDPESIVFGEPPGVTLAINAPNDPNNGLMDIDGDDNDGQVVINRNSTLELNVQQINGTTAGTITMYGNSTLDLGVPFGIGNAPVDDSALLWVNSGATGGIPNLPAAPAVVTGDRFLLTPRGTVYLPQSDAELRFESEFVGLFGTISNNGTIHFAGDARIDEDISFGGNGEIVNDFGSTLALRPGVDADMEFVNDGTLMVFGDDVTIDAFSQSTAGTLELRIGDILPGDWDVLSVEGNAVLGGTLFVELVDDFEPVLGNSFSILNTVFGNVSGEFDLEDVPEFNGLTFDVIYNPQSVVLEVIEAGVTGDYNDDGVVNAADYTVWRDLLGEAVAMPNEIVTPGMVTQEDYDQWKAHFGEMAGSGAGHVSTTKIGIPEPTSLALTALAAAWFWLARRQT